jgi:hypothetical protein
VTTLLAVIGRAFTNETLANRTLIVDLPDRRSPRCRVSMIVCPKLLIQNPVRKRAQKPLKLRDLIQHSVQIFGFLCESTVKIGPYRINVLSAFRIIVYDVYRILLAGLQF